MPTPRPIVILGPTAGGKSDLAVALAERLPGGGQIIGADAFQIYRHLDAGTAKPDASLRQRVPHHLFDVVDPTDQFTVHDWLTRAKKAIADIQQQGQTPIVVGGTNLYIKALLDGLFDGPGRDAAFRTSLQGIDTPLLHARLIEVDPETASRVFPADRQRIVRALEVYQLTGKPISELQTQWDGQADDADKTDDASALADSHSRQGIDAELLGLRWTPDAINPRINLRVKAMFYPDRVDPELARSVCVNGESLVDEVVRLLDEGWFGPVACPDAGDAPNQARQALGYKQLLASIDGTDPKITSAHEAFEKTKILTRRFAKQQRTWLKRFTQARWIDADDAEPEALVDAAMKVLNSPPA